MKVRAKCVMFSQVLFVAFISASFVIAGCTKKKPSTANSSQSEELPPIETNSSQNIVLSGSFALVSFGSRSLNLNEQATYSLAAYTIEDNPKSCLIDLAPENTFEKVCEQFAGNSFFVTVQERSLDVHAIIRFTVDKKQQIQLTAGAGTIAFSVSFDPFAKSAVAMIDLARSSALSPEAVAATPSSTVATSLGSVDQLHGEFKVVCLKSHPVGQCEDLVASQDFFLNQWKFGDRTFVSVWESKSAYDFWFADVGPEASPPFKIATQSGPVPVELTDYKSAIASFDAAIAKVSPDLRQHLITVAKENDAWLADRCDAEQDEAKTFSDGNCRFVDAPLVEHQIFDFESQRNVTVIEPKFYKKSEFDSLSDYSGVVNVVEKNCDEDAATDIPWCPSHAAGGKFKVFKSTSGGEIRLICKESDPDAAFLIQESVLADNKPQALTLRRGQQSPECHEKMFNGQPELTGHIDTAKESLAILAMERANAKDYQLRSDEKICANYEISPSFSFLQCEKQATSDPNDLHQVCWDIVGNMDRLGLKIDRSSGRLVKKTGANISFDRNFALKICSTYAGAIDENSWWNDFVANQAACQEEFVTGLTAVEQANRLHQYVKLSYLTLDRLFCDANPGLRNEMRQILADSRVPYYWVGTDSRESSELHPEVLQCAHNSICVEGGIFKGPLPGRFVMGDLNPGAKGAFEVLQTDDRSYVDENEQPPRRCAVTQYQALNGRFLGLSVFEAELRYSQSDSCQLRNGENSQSFYSSVTYTFTKK